MFEIMILHIEHKKCVSGKNGYYQFLCMQVLTDTFWDEPMNSCGIDFLEECLEENPHYKLCEACSLLAAIDPSLCK